MPPKPLSKDAVAFFTREAEDLLATFNEDPSHYDQEEEMKTYKHALRTLIDEYCAMPDIAEQQVRQFEMQLPHHADRTRDAFIAWRTLVHTAEILGKTASDARSLMKGHDPIADLSAAGGDKKPTIDDTAIRESAGYNADEDVAKSSLQDKAREHNVTDDDIGQSMWGEEKPYDDEYGPTLTPAQCYRQMTRQLFMGIIGSCLGDQKYLRLQPLIENNIIQRPALREAIETMRAQITAIKLPDDEAHMQE